MDRSLPWPVCRTRGIWGRFCVLPRHSAQRAFAAKVKLAEVLPELKKRGIRLLATSSHKGVPLPEANFQKPLAFFIGGEGAGVPKDLLAKVDEVVAIPHAAQVESLNAGVAASIVLYEMKRVGG